MEERQQIQLQILQELIRYSDHLIPAVQMIIDELRGDQFEDTQDYLGDIISGINWEIEVYNQCAPLINERSNYINKRAMVSAVQHLGIAINSEDDLMIADVLESDFLPFTNKLDLAAKKVIEYEEMKQDAML